MSSAAPVICSKLSVRGRLYAPVSRESTYKGFGDPAQDNRKMMLRPLADLQLVVARPVDIGTLT